MVDGWRWRHERRRDQEAIWTAALMNACGHLKHPIQPARLLGRPVGVDPKSKAELTREALARRGRAT